MKARPWTNGEIEKIRNNYPTTPAIKIAEELDRPIGEVISKAIQLGVTKNEKTK